MPKRPNSAETAYQHIRGAVLAGSYPPGSRIKEEILAESIGVSRTPIREALRRLHSEGVVRMIPNRGAHVMSFSDEELEELFALRADLDGYAAGLAASKITEEHVDQLSSMVDEMHVVAAKRGTGWLERLADLDRDLHQGVFESTENGALVKIASSFREIPGVLKTFDLYTEEQLDRSHRHHREIVDALRAGNPGWAEAISRAHVMAAREILYRPEDGETVKLG
ncbi:GntR family transcriptional regulator [soil metagenome]